MAHNYVVTAHKQTAVTSCVTGNNSQLTDHFQNGMGHTSLTFNFVFFVVNRQFYFTQRSEFDCGQKLQT